MYPFDLRLTSEVQIEILDIRGNHVARILPGRGLAGPLAPGQYGRATVGSSSGCDDRLTWDGTDDHGKFVPPACTWCASAATARPASSPSSGKVTDTPW